MKKIINFSGYSVSSSMLLLLSAIYVVLIDNTTFWNALSNILAGSLFENILVQFSFAVIFIFILYVFMSIFCIKKSTRYFVIGFLIISAIISYFIDDFGVVISTSMIQNVVETDINEAFDLFSFNLLKHVFIFGVLPSIVVYFISLKKQSVSGELVSRAGMLLLILIVTSSSVFISAKDIAFIGRENRDLRFYVNPIYPVASVYKHLKMSIKDKNLPLEEVFSDSNVIKLKSADARNTLLVIVVGETARAANFNLNGYNKNTTPLLNNIDVINYSNTFSCGTATAESLPCMFSDVSHNDFDLDKIRNRENLLDALTYAKVDVLWRENNSGCKGVCSRSKTEIMHLTGSDSLCKGDECYDAVLLNDLDSYVKNIKQDTVVVLHQQGSHGPAYYKRTPDEFAVFQPTCNSKALQDCSDDAVTNAYDNTIVYTDYLLSEIIAILKSNSGVVNTAMIYMSDHGESLGENGVYLHGLPYFMAPVEQTHIPFIVWLSDDIKDDKNIDDSCLKDNSSNQYSHDNLIHSVLGVMDVNTIKYRQELDVFSSCRRNKSHIVGISDESELNDKS